jgi:eukaryotic-like serine/threonine-protein kinase
MQKKEIKGYTVIRPIFQGGMTDLYVAQTADGKRVVVRFLKAQYARQSAIRKRFLQAANILQALQHPLIVPLIDAGTHEGVPFMILDYVESHTLRELILDRTPWVHECYRHLIRELAAALYFIHQSGYLHLDFKPENILVKPDGHIVVIDFDLAVKRKAKPVRLTDYPGTPAYLAPEILLHQQADERADIFSFGVICYELFTFHKPFERDNLDDAQRAQAALDVLPTPFDRYGAMPPPAIKDLIFKSLAKELDKRYPDMSLILKTIDTMR